jgi:hypothetical protein
MNAELLWTAQRLAGELDDHASVFRLSHGDDPLAMPRKRGAWIAADSSRDPLRAIAFAH